MAAPKNFVTKSELRHDGAFQRWVAGVTQVLGQVLADNSIHGQFGSRMVSPQFVTWELLLDKHTKGEVSKVHNLDPVFESAVGRSGIVVRQPKRGPLRIEVPSPRRVLVPAQTLPNYEQETGVWRAALGVQADWTPLTINLRNVPHLLILGATGLGGKTGALSNIIFQLARQQSSALTKMVLIDLKGSAHEESLSQFAGLSHNIFEPIYTVNEAKDALLWVWDEMERRKKQPKPNHLFVFVDETYRLANEWGRADKFLGELAAESRSFNIHLVLATQIATQETLATSMVTQNIVARLVGPVHSGNSSAWATGRKGAGAEELQGNGDMIAALPGSLVRIQSGYVTADCIEGLRQTGRMTTWKGIGRNARPLPSHETVKEDAPVNEGKVDVSVYADWFYENAKPGEAVASQYLARKDPEEGGLGLSGPVSGRAQEYAKEKHSKGPETVST